MPIYEYSCPDCGVEFERMRKLSDPPLTVCPDCGRENVRKLISQTSFMLKGGGWYSDHYGLKSGGSESAKPAAAGGAGAAESASAAPAAAPAPAPSAPAGGSASGGSSSTPAGS